MDIPRVLETINGGVYKNLRWGPCANTGNTYEELAEKWPESNLALPTKVQMEAHWAIISAGD